jgi:hypothetical protein
MKRYWYCIIGPVEDDKIPNGADSPPRLAARMATTRMTGKDPTCMSGWVDEDTLLNQINSSAFFIIENGDADGRITRA